MSHIYSTCMNCIFRYLVHEVSAVPSISPTQLVVADIVPAESAEGSGQSPRGKPLFRAAAGEGQGDVIGPSQPNTREVWSVLCTGDQNAFLAVAKDSVIRCCCVADDAECHPNLTARGRCPSLINLHILFKFLLIKTYQLQTC